jgi:predicted nucleotidyltransferase
MDIATEVVRLARSILGGEVEVILFGSWAQGRAEPHSDIDLAVSTGEPIPHARMALLRQAADDLPTLYSIDIVDLGSVSPALHDEILGHGKRL